jgi:membrane-associated HD superfamily phosphohydrolase
MARVEPVFVADSGILDVQLARLDGTLTQIDRIRVDTSLDGSQKLSALAATDRQDGTLGEALELSDDAAEEILALSDDRWQAVRQEARAVLAKVMVEPIAQGEEDAARQRVRLVVSLSLAESEARIVRELATAFVRDNLREDEEATEAARQAAKNSIEPQRRVIMENEIILRAGEIVTVEDLETMETLGFETDVTFFDIPVSPALRGPILIGLTVLGALGLYVRSMRRRARAIWGRVEEMGEAASG